MNKALRILTLLAVCTFATTASAEPDLSEKLKPLSFMLGDWNLGWVEPNGQKIKGKATVKPDLGGSTVVLRADMSRPDGTPLFSRMTIFYWNHETQCVAESTFESHTGHGSSTLTKASANALSWKGRAYSPQAKVITAKPEITKVDANSWTAQFRSFTHDGNPVPDSPVVTFTRAK